MPFPDGAPYAQSYRNHKYYRRRSQHVEVAERISQLLNPLAPFLLYLQKPAFGLMNT
jgi:hypothetical protein